MEINPFVVLTASSALYCIYRGIKSHYFPTFAERQFNSLSRLVGLANRGEAMEFQLKHLEDLELRGLVKKVLGGMRFKKSGRMHISLRYRLTDQAIP